MKVSIARQDLLDTVNKVKSVVSAKSALPILSHLLLETTDTGIRLAATDLKVSIESSVDCTVEESGSCTMSAQRISSILPELPEEPITLEMQDKNIVRLTCGRIDTRLYSMAPEEFPPIREFEGIAPAICKQGLLKRLFGKCSFAICSDQARYNLTGLLFEIGAGRLTVVATDGRRMSLAYAEEGVPEEAAAKVIIPQKMIHELERLLSDDADVEVYLDESQVAFAFGNLRLVSALIEGNFPNYDMVVPKKHDKVAVVDTSVFSNAMRRTRTMTNDKFNSVRISVEEGQMVLRVVTPEVGEYTEELGIDYEGEKVEIAFNPDFLLEVLRHMDTGQVALVLKDSVSPGVVKPYDEAVLDDYVNVIMPIRI